MSLPYCKCGHDVEYHPNGGGCSKLCATGQVCNCEEFNDSRIAELETQLAEAKKDCARLEEIFKFGCVELAAKHDEWRMTVSQYLYSQCEWYVTGLYFGKTPRAVIDQAIADKQKGGQNDEN